MTKQSLEDKLSSKPNIAAKSKDGKKGDQAKKKSDGFTAAKVSEVPEKKVFGENLEKVLVDPPQNGKIMMTKMQL